MKIKLGRIWKFGSSMHTCTCNYQLDKEITKVLIKLSRCVVWFVSLLFAFYKNRFLSRYELYGIFMEALCCASE